MGIDVVAGQVLQENTTMLAMCREFGFTAEPLDVASHVVAVRIHTKPSEKIAHSSLIQVNSGIIRMSWERYLLIRENDHGWTSNCDGVF